MRRYECLIRDPKLIEKMLNVFDVAFLGMFDEEYPYVVPLNFGYDIKDGKLFIYVHCALTGHKLELMKRNPNVCASFAKFQNHPDVLYKGHIHDHRSVMAFGKMSLIPKRDIRWFPAAHRLLDQYNRRHDQYRPERIPIMDMYVIECDWDNVYGKSEMPVRTIKDVPFVDVANMPRDLTPYDRRDLYAKRVDDPWERRKKIKEIAIVEKMRKSIVSEKTAELFKKGEKIQFGTRNVMVSLFWKQEPGCNEEIECNLMAFVLRKPGVLKERWDVVFYNQPVHDSGYWQDTMVIHTGEGNSGDERLLIYFPKVKPKYDSIVVLFSIYDAANRNQNLSLLKNVKLIATDYDTNGELFAVDINEHETDKRSVFIGRFYRNGNEWELNVSNRADPENNVVMLSTQFGIRQDWRHIKSLTPKWGKLPKP